MNVRERKGTAPTDWRNIRKSRKMHTVIIQQDNTTDIPLYSATFINQSGAAIISNKKFRASQFIKHMKGYEAYFDAASKILYAAMKPKPVSPPSTPPSSPKIAAVSRASSFYYSSSTIFNVRSSEALQMSNSGRLLMGQDVEVRSMRKK